MRGLNPISRTSGLSGEAKSADRFKAASRDARMNKVAKVVNRICRFCRAFSSRL